MCGIAPGLFLVTNRTTIARRQQYKKTRMKKTSTRLRRAKPEDKREKFFLRGYYMLLLLVRVLHIVLCDNVERTALDFDVGLGQIFSDDAKSHEDHTAKEEHEGKE